MRFPTARRECARAFRSAGLFFAALQVERGEIKAPRATGEEFLAVEPENMGDPRVAPCLMALRWLLAIETARAAKSRGCIAKARARAESLAT